jgi:hypothetical protein
MMSYPNEFLDEVEVVNHQPLDLPSSEESQLDCQPQLEDLVEEEAVDLSVQPSCEPEVLSQISSPLALKENESQIKEEDLKAIADHGMDADWLYKNLKKGIEQAVVQWPKGEILDDRKARANLINAFMKATGRFKPDNTINILNLFGKVNTKWENNIY